VVGINTRFLDVGSFTEGEYMLQMNLWDKEKRNKWNLISVYGAAQEENKKILAELALFCSKSKEPYLLNGDFNIIRFPSEKHKVGPMHRHYGTFNAIINAYELMEIVMNGGKYTWSNNQTPPTLEKLDRFLSKGWEDIFPRVVVRKLPREISDHNPLILITENNTPLKHLDFKFELSWLKQPEFTDKVAEIWEKSCHAASAFDRVQIKLKRFKQFFKGWGFNHLGEQKKLKQNIQAELWRLEQDEEEAPLTFEQYNRKADLMCQSLNILVEEELYWYKRSHGKWLLERDGNTEFFHRMANGRKRKKHYFSSPGWGEDCGRGSKFT
jgi:hypothetical protein